MTIEIDGRLMFNRATVHEHLKRALSLPDYYGSNLDALYDVLTERVQPTDFVVSHVEMLDHQLGRYAKALLGTLRDAAENNPAITVSIN